MHGETVKNGGICLLLTALEYTELGGDEAVLNFSFSLFGTTAVVDSTCGII
jgi:hypothetical protein